MEWVKIDAIATPRDVAPAESAMRTGYVILLHTLP
jgi:hypothetical protein